MSCVAIRNWVKLGIGKSFVKPTTTGYEKSRSNRVGGYFRLPALIVKPSYPDVPL